MNKSFDVNIFIEIYERNLFEANSWERRKKSANTKQSFKYKKDLDDPWYWLYALLYVLVNNAKYSMNLAIHIILYIMQSQISVWMIAIQFVTFWGILLFFGKILWGVAEKHKLPNIQGCLACTFILSIGFILFRMI